MVKSKKFYKHIKGEIDMRKLNKRQKELIQSVANEHKNGTIFSQLDLEVLETLEKMHDYETLYQDANRYFVDCMLSK